MKAKIKELFAIDSLKLRIPFNLIKILDSDILDEKSKIFLNKTSGEIISDEEVKALSTQIKFNNYHIKVALVVQYDFQLKTNFEYLEIALHSKILEGNYFEGITEFNIELIYKKLMDAKVFYCDYETFTTSRINDIDIKYDFYSDKDTFKELCSDLKARAKQSNQLGKGIASYNNDNLTFNRRESSTLHSPFVKFYDKQIEVREKNKAFFDSYIPFELIKDKKRIESTIKKSSDIKKFFNLDVSNFNSILYIPQHELKRYVSYSIQQNIDTAIKIEKSLDSFKSAIDIQIHIHFTNSIQNQNSTFLKTLNSYLIHFEDKQMKIRIKKKCIEWNLRSQAKPDEKNLRKEIKKSTAILDIFELLQIN